MFDAVSIRSVDGCSFFIKIW